MNCAQITGSKDLPLLQEFRKLSMEERKSALMLYDPGPEYTKFDEMENITEEERRFLRTVPNGTRRVGSSRVGYWKKYPYLIFVTDTTDMSV